MKLPQNIQQALAAGDLDTIEGDWLARITDRPEELDYFVTLAEALTRQDEKGRAAELLELLDEELRERGHWQERLELIHESGRHYLRSGRVHATVLESVRELYRDQGKNLDRLLGLVGLDQSKETTTKLWDKVERLKNLLAFEVGTIVAMKDKGVGRVVEVNHELQTLKIDFHRFRGLAVGLRAAGKVLEILPEGHIQRRALEAPEELLELRDREPSELLRITLASYDRPLTSGELRVALAGIVDAEDWTSWWSAARKHPQVLRSGSGSRQTHRWAETAADAEGEVWRTFEAAAPREKLDQLRQYSKRQDVRRRMGAALLPLAESTRSEDPVLAFEIRAALERSGETLPDWSEQDLIRELDEPLPFVTALSSRSHRQQAYRAIREARDDWWEIFEAAVWQEKEARLLDVVMSVLEEEDGERAAHLVDRIAGVASRAPAAFTWIAERAADDESIRSRRPLRLLKQILTAMHDDDMAPFRTRIQALFESGSTVPRLLPQLDEENAAEAVALLTGASGIEDYQREPLLNALYLRFPDLQQEREEPLYTTHESLEAKRDELRALMEEEIPANRRAIEEARALGDLRENFEYKAARQRHEYLNARAASLHNELTRAQPLDPDRIETSEVRVGTRCELTGADGSRRQVTILGPWESRPEEGIVSYESELGQKLLGRRVGDQVEAEESAWKVTAISAFHESA